MPMHVVFFVYGTLCRGQCRESMWPHAPEVIAAAWTWGTLYGRDDYPALLPGTDEVLGECWFFSDDRASDVVRALDVIEGTDQPGHPNLYDRVVTQATLLEATFGLAAGVVVAAQCYHYAADPLRDGFHRIIPAKNARARWPEC